MAGFGLAMIGFGLSTSFWLSLACLTFSGAMDYISVMVRGTLVQVLTPRHLLGRVTSVQHIFIGAGNEIGAFESGVAARLMGLVPSVVFGGLVTIGVVVGVARYNPELRRLGSLRTPAK
jgi:sugar phosphate permease